MHPRVRAVLLAGAALVALAPSSGVAALAAHRAPAMSHAGDQGLTWSVVPSPNRKANPPENQLVGVTCLSATSCTAVGYGAKKDPGTTFVVPKTLVERWNGSAWSIVPSPNRAGVDELQGVSCVSASACTAVGWSAPSPKSGPSSVRTLIETWNGTAWSIVPSPNPRTGTGNFLFGVSCVTAAFCAAVGSYGQPDTAKSDPITEIWNGSTWSVAPHPQKLHNAELASVSCVSATACTAVGSHRRLTAPRGTLVESWNGSSWSVVPSADAGTSDKNVLSGVSCTSATACTAVGSYFDIGLPAPVQQTLAESWNGSSWSVVPSPDLGTGTDNFLYSVSCASGTSCIAVGTASHGTIADTLIEAWNGSSWSAVPSPGTENISALLNGVSCPSASMCMAAGGRFATANSPLRTL